MRNEEEFDIGELLSRIINSDIFMGAIGFIIFYILYIIPSAILEQYEKTLLLPYLFIYTILRLVVEKPLQILFYAFIFVFLKKLLFDNFKNKWFKIFCASYIMICFLFLAGQTIDMNTSYELHNRPLTTTHVLCYQVLDMIGNDTVTFYDEPCRTESKGVSYYTKRKRKRFRKKVEFYDYLCLDKQRDVIPIPSKYCSEIEKLLEEHGGVCDITCYKNTHLIKAINGVELKDLGK